MKRNKHDPNFTRALLMAGAAVSLASATTGLAQSVDSLLDKLVDKGVLTQQEAKQLRTEADKDFTHAYAAKSGMPDFVSALKLNGDFRGRYEGFFYGNDDAVDRSRWRYRLRFGVTALMMDNFEVGFRLGSGDIDSANRVVAGTDPISNNQSLQNNASKKGIFIDLAYGKWHALNQPAALGSLTIGKMENPFVFTDMVFDHDYTPEGAAGQFTFNVSHEPEHAQTIKFNAGGFVLDELSGDSADPYMLGGQLRWDGQWGRRLQSSLGFAALAIFNEETLNYSTALTVNGGPTSTTTTPTVPNINAGNTRTPLGVPTTTSGVPGGSLTEAMNPLIADASLTYTLEKAPFYSGFFPIKIGGEYMYNPGADNNNTGWNVGITFGKASKRRTWEVSYVYKVLEANAWYEEFVDSDFGAYYRVASPSTVGFSSFGDYYAGTNVRGHVAKLSYAPADCLVLSAKVFVTDLITPPTTGIPAGSDNKSDTMRLQVDAVWKF